MTWTLIYLAIGFVLLVVGMLSSSNRAEYRKLNACRRLGLILSFVALWPMSMIDGFFSRE
jgi:hypothetical protein